MPNLKYSGAGCKFETGEFEDASIVIALLNNHTTVSHSMLPCAKKGPKVDRPILSDNLTEEKWNGFLQGWKLFTEANSVSIEDQPVQLFACCDTDLRAKATSTNEKILDSSVEEMLVYLHKLSVVPVAIFVQRTELLRMTQSSDEPIRAFFSRVRGKSLICRFRMNCPYQHANDMADKAVFINYTDEIIRHVVIAGL